MPKLTSNFISDPTSNYTHVALITYLSFIKRHNPKSLSTLCDYPSPSYLINLIKSPTIALSHFIRILSALDCALILRDSLQSSQSSQPSQNPYTFTSPSSIPSVLHYLIASRNASSSQLSDTLHFPKNASISTCIRYPGRLTLTMFGTLLTTLNYDLIVKDLDTPATEYDLFVSTPSTIPDTPTTPTLEPVVQATSDAPYTTADPMTTKKAILAILKSHGMTERDLNDIMQYPYPGFVKRKLSSPNDFPVSLAAAFLYFLHSHLLIYDTDTSMVYPIQEPLTNIPALDPDYEP